MKTDLFYTATKAEFANDNPILSEGEIGYEIDTKRWKLGNGNTAWNSLAYTTSLVINDAGNIIANIIPRTGTLAGLKALAVSGQGELSSATDVSAIVQFNGTSGAGTAKVYSPMAPGVWTDSTNTLTTVNTSALTIQAKAQSGTANGAGVNVIGGNAINGNGGQIQLSGGSSSQSDGGGFLMQAGTGVTQDRDGLIEIVAGNGMSIFFAGSGAALGGAENTVCAGFFGASPAPQQTPALAIGSSRVAVAGGNAVDDNDTFTGGVGTTGYTIGQVVGALKNFGFLTA